MRSKVVYLITDAQKLLLGEEDTRRVQRFEEENK